MKNLLTATQMHDADAYTIKQQEISSVDLMEHAAKAFVKFFKKKFPDKEKQISILCGNGNNGGDGLAIARLLHNEEYENISVFLINFGTRQSKDYTENLARLAKTKLKPIVITAAEQFENKDVDLIIDAILGSGLNKPFTGKYVELASKLNALHKTILSVDVPTGFPGEGLIDRNYKGIKADLVICFQRPKINFFFPESIAAFDRFVVVDIGLDEDYLENAKADWKLIVKPSIRQRKNFTHKGTYGHALIVAGNTSTMGAALLAARACLYAGSGLTTLCLPSGGLIALNSTLPEVMALPRTEYLAIEVFEKFTSIAIGPGFGIEEENEALFSKLIELKKPMVIDADALNMLAKRKDLLDKLPWQTILTPHVKEFDLLFGEHQSWWDRVETARKHAKQRKLIIVLKNQYTFVCLPTGEVCINQTGNPSMASGGMGDVLTGIMVGLLAQSYSATDAATLAVYVHGKAGDELAEKRFTVGASQVAKRIAKIMKKLVAEF
ncbi:NAD(P)H-hydrate dehydratase [Pedobacter sp. Du54]|uniref:NAD(P)H-hydrate dehydratase n=1 Tax=Pedobacter anseongensis TaxID=3133439 RepID=UPI0030B7B91E